MMSIDFSELPLKVADRVALSQTPTPIHALPHLSKMLGTQIYCKRDDLTGFGFGGNKVRKLEYLLSEPLRYGSDCLITCGSNQSNWCCMTSVAGAALGMDVYLVLGGPVPKVDTGNLRLARIAGARISHVDTTDDDVLESAAGELEDVLRARGRRPYRIIMGGSTGLGSFGYVRALAEIASFERTAGLRFSRIIHATGSAGTQAGLIAGSMLGSWPGEINGIAVSRSATEQEAKVRAVLAQTLPRQLLDQAHPIIDDRFMGGGYRQKTDGCNEAIEIFARREGIFLDEVYTGKAAAALIAYGREGRFNSGENVLFLHTGGAAQLFE
ncbi:MAG: D-cysteine desulfhydrase family protein [Proteobacteria bacterium]|nr:D-cysteine desulfhydrase family protein [Pseudomonadota bacterium]